MIDEVGPAHQSPNQKIPINHSLREPFIGMAGHCFLKLGIWMDHISFRRPTEFPRSTRVSAGRKLAEARRFSLRNITHSWLGTGSCVVAAAGLTAVFYGSSFKNTLPFIFIAVVLIVTLLFGREAGVLGTLGAALIFASVLFEPRPSLAMNDPTAQTHLIWMIVIGVVVADLFGRESPHNTLP
jgi:K+-sensing histidine kinase KdpD